VESQPMPRNLGTEQELVPFRGMNTLLQPMEGSLSNDCCQAWVFPVALRDAAPAGIMGCIGKWPAVALHSLPARSHAFLVQQIVDDSSFVRSGISDRRHKASIEGGGKCNGVWKNCRVEDWRTTPGDPAHACVVPVIPIDVKRLVILKL